MNIFSGCFESILVKKIDKLFNYFRYVDDIFISNKKDYNVEYMFIKISNLFPNLKKITLIEIKENKVSLIVYIFFDFNVATFLQKY